MIHGKTFRENQPCRELPSLEIPQPILLMLHHFTLLLPGGRGFLALYFGLIDRRLKLLIELRAGRMQAFLDDEDVAEIENNANADKNENREENIFHELSIRKKMGRCKGLQKYNGEDFA